jgi:hypothetical protein
MRKFPLRRVGDDPECREGEAIRGRNPSGNMGLRICRERTCLKMQSAPLRNSGDRHVDAGDVREQRPTKRLGKPPRPNGIAFKARPVRGDHVARDELCPGVKILCQAACNAKTDNRGGIIRGSGLDSARKTQDIPAAGKSRNARARGNSCFRREASDRKNGTAAYIPVWTGGLFPFIRLR